MILGAIASFVVGICVGVILACVAAFVVSWVVSVASSTRAPEFDEIFARRVWVVIPMVAILAVAVDLFGAGYLAGGIGFAFSLILAFQVGRAYQYYSYN